MAQQKQLSWIYLRVGIFVLAGLVLTGITIFYVTGGHFFGAKYRLITYMPEVSGLATCAPVNLDGILVGNVQSFSFTPHPEDLTRGRGRAAPHTASNRQVVAPRDWHAECLSFSA